MEVVPLSFLLHFPKRIQMIKLQLVPLTSTKGREAHSVKVLAQIHLQLFNDNFKSLLNRLTLTHLEKIL